MTESKPVKRSSAGNKPDWKYKLKLWIFSPFVVFFIYLVGFTCRVQKLGVEHLEELKKNGGRWVLCTWHETLLMGIWLLRFSKIVTMASNSKQGEIAVRISWFLGHRHVRGSSSEGGRDALEGMADVAKAGKVAIMVSDGPRGPRHKLQAGIVALAQKTGYPIIPYHYEADRQWVAEKSWDKLRFPKPFSKIVMRYGEPIYVPAELTKEEFTAYQAKVEKAMMDNVEECRKRVQPQAS